MTRVLLDEGLPLRAAQCLRDRGSMRFTPAKQGWGPRRTPRFSGLHTFEQRVCVTLDHDFHSLLAETAANAPSVILLRIQRAGYIETAVAIERLLKEFHSQFAEGIALTASARGVRFRRLPLK